MSIETVFYRITANVIRFCWTVPATREIILSAQTRPGARRQATVTREGRRPNPPDSENG